VDAAVVGPVVGPDVVETEVRIAMCSRTYLSEGFLRYWRESYFTIKLGRLVTPANYRSER